MPLVRIWSVSLFVVSSVLASTHLNIAGSSDKSASTYLTGVSLDNDTSVQTWSDGDLWPSCWSDDDNLYAANGDGRGFNLLAWTYSDIVINRIIGSPPSLSGQALATSDEVGQVWDTTGNYNRKPTGMVCVNGDLYVAIQDLSRDYNDAPNASISRSTDHGQTWTWDRTSPMFSNYIFTTIMFLDYGKDSINGPSQYVYAYGLDYNWRESNTHIVPNPLNMYLARVPKNSIQTRSTWQFYTGVDNADKPLWSADINAKVPVLQNAQISSGTDQVSGLSQGGVVYDEALNRYIFTTWTEFSFEFYEAPQPWGPWVPFLSRYFGIYPWTSVSYGGYGTTIPSKFISPDGKSMWLQSNVCPCGNAGISDYHFSLRKLTIALLKQT